MDGPDSARRRLLAMCGAAAATLSGCVGGGTATDPGKATLTDSEPPPSPTPSDAATPEATDTPAASGPAKLVATDGDAADDFGFVVDADDGTVVVGALSDEDPAGKEAGSAYVFEETADGWQEAAKLSPAGVGTGAHFGWAVAVDDDTAMVGARDADIEIPDQDQYAGKNAGSVYVFERGEGDWPLVTRLTAPNGNRIDHFGNSVALASGRALVGAPLKGGGIDDLPSRAGAAYVVERSGGKWRVTDRLTAPDREEADTFGIDVAVDGDTVLVGAASAAGTEDSGAGTAHVFERSGGGWTETATLSGSGAGPGAIFGYEVALDGDAALVGAAREERDNGQRKGAAYLFERDAGWTETRRLAPSLPGDGFAEAVALAGDRALVGAQGHGGQGAYSGMVYAYRRGASGWGGERTYRPEVTDENDQVGDSVVLDADRTVLGAPGEEDPNGGYAGAVYVYQR